MPDFNTVILAGRLSQEPESRYTTSGTPITEFSIAVNRKSSEKTETLFASCICFGKTAENVARYMQKGSSILISGFLRQESWTTRDGAKRSTIKVVCDTVQFLDRRPAGNDAPPPVSAPAPAPGGHKYPASDIPQNMYQRPPSPQPTNDPHYENIDNVNVDDIPF
jgi:single-strand DNA-binding protein